MYGIVTALDYHISISSYDTVQSNQPFLDLPPVRPFDEVKLSFPACSQVRFIVQFPKNLSDGDFAYRNPVERLDLGLMNRSHIAGWYREDG